MSVAIRRDRPGHLAEATDEVLTRLGEVDAVRRLWARDHTLWSDDPIELADRLGWLEVAEEMLGAAAEIDGFVEGCRADGLTDVVVMGMGGSSLFPEVLARSFPQSDGLRLHVLDSTDPAAVGRIAAQLDPATTLYLASSKSGSTIETRSHLEFFWDRVEDGSRFAVVTDPGSELGQLARSRDFRHVFENRADIGGRYSALSFFGLVPAALAGVDWQQLVRGALDLAPDLAASDVDRNPGLRLGALLAAGVGAGRDKATFLLDSRIEAFGLWLEQLIAESTGKGGTGVVPVADEPLGALDVYGDDRIFVAIGEVPQSSGLDAMSSAGHPVIEVALDGPLDLGAQVLLWEVATALCGAALEINPFDQPNVAEAKAATHAVLDGGAPDLDLGDLEQVLAAAGPGDYLSIQAYLDPQGGDVEALQAARLELRDELVVATTLGLGPRFLHSTGQLHKGGPPTGLFLQVVGGDPADAAIPGQPFTFSELKHAQADGDLLTLRRHGLRAARVTVDQLVARTGGGA